MTDRELMQQALEALEADEHDMVLDQEGHMVFRKESAITALRERLAQPEQELVMKRIKTWSERCEEHPDHQQGMISEGMIRARMQEEIDELRQALETEQEPVAWVTGWHDGHCVIRAANPSAILPIGIALYTPPPRREWVGLTKEEAKEISLANRPYVVDMIAALEAKLKEKNT